MWQEMIPKSASALSNKFVTYYSAKTDIPSSGKIVCGFEPKIICCLGTYNNTAAMAIYVNTIDSDPTKFYRWLGSTATSFTISTSETNAGIISIDSTGFTLNANGRNQLHLQVLALG